MFFPGDESSTGRQAGFAKWYQKLGLQDRTTRQVLIFVIFVNCRSPELEKTIHHVWNGVKHWEARLKWGKGLFRQVKNRSCRSYDVTIVVGLFWFFLQAWLKPFKKDLSVSLDTVVILAEDCMLKQL